MKSSTIWESASRPLFVKSVLLEAGHHHFILDYETKQKLNFNPNIQNNHETLHDTSYCGLRLDKELHLVGSSKLQYHQNSLEHEKISNENYRSLSTKHLIDHYKKKCNFLLEEAPSKRSSLHDISSILSTNSHSDEKLAERVLNWLDLAGKTPLFRPIYDAGEDNLRKKIKKVQSYQKLQAQSACSGKNDSVRHVTIIFNKEGVPVKLHRPVINIVSSTCSHSKRSTRELCENSASTKLCNENSEKENGFLALKSPKPRLKKTCFRKNLNSNTIGKQKVIPELKNDAIRETKRQLHIFMPNLPKKMVSNEEMLCHELNRMCRMNSL